MLQDTATGLGAVVVVLNSVYLLLLVGLCFTHAVRFMRKGKLAMAQGFKRVRSVSSSGWCEGRRRQVEASGSKLHPPHWSFHLISLLHRV